MATFGRGFIQALTDPTYSQGLFGAGALIGSAPARQRQQEKRQGLLQDLMQTDPIKQAQALQALGAETRDPRLILQGTQLASQAQKQQSLIQIDTFLDQLADPTQSEEQRASATAKAETIAFSPAVNMTPQSFNALVSSANSRRDSTLNTQARSMVETDGAGAVPRYISMYGQGESWRVQNALKANLQTREDIRKQGVNQFVLAQAGDIARIESEIAQYQNIPINEWDMKALNNLYKQRLNIEQAIVDKGGQGDPSRFIGGAERFYDEVFQIQSDRKKIIADQIDVRIDKQRNFLYNMAKNSTAFTSDQFVDAARKNPEYSDWEESDWDALEADIASFQETRASKSEYLRNGKLAPTDEAWLNKYPNYFSDDDEFNSDLKTYRAKNTDNLSRLEAGNRLTAKIRGASAQQRQDARSDRRVKERATDFVEAFIGAGDPDDPRFDPNIPVEGGFMQGDSVYDVIRRLQLTGDDRYDKLITKVGNKIKDNPQAKMRKTVMEAFSELYIETPGEAAVQERQAVIAQQTEVMKEGIAIRQKQHKKETGEDLSEEEAAILIQQDLANVLAADAERMSLAFLIFVNKCALRDEQLDFLKQLAEWTCYWTRIYWWRWRCCRCRTSLCSRWPAF